MSTPLNKSGFNSTRNKSKPFRQQRLNKDGSLNRLDNIGGCTKPLNTTGCFGSVSTWGVRVYIPGPKTGRRNDRTKKRPCRLVSRDEMLEIPDKLEEKLFFIRNQIRTLRIVEELTGEELCTPMINSFWPKINARIMATVPTKVLTERDNQQYRSMEGQYNIQGFGRFNSRILINTIEFVIKKGLL